MITAVQLNMNSEKSVLPYFDPMPNPEFWSYILFLFDLSWLYRVIKVDDINSMIISQPHRHVRSSSWKEKFTYTWTFDISKETKIQFSLASLTQLVFRVNFSFISWMVSEGALEHYQSVIIIQYKYKSRNLADF